MPIIETTEFHMDLCVLVVTKKFGLHFGEELPTEGKFNNFEDCYTVAMK